MKCVLDSASLPRYEDCDFLYFEPASVSKITEGMKTNFESRNTGRKKSRKKREKKRKRKKGKKKKPEMCRNNEIFLCFLGRYGMMQTDAQLTSSPKDTDAHKHSLSHTHARTHARTHNGGTFNHNFKTTPHLHALTHPFSYHSNAWNTHMHVCTRLPVLMQKHNLISWLVQPQRLYKLKNSDLN